jgi:hypothetical protein
MRTKKLVCAMLVSTIFVGISPEAAASQNIQSSHIESNVPDERDFDSFLKRDLAKYFADLKKKEVEVSYELLRKQPTQSGVAYPKFYLWVKVSGKEELIEEGAIRVAAIEKKEFQITDYLSKQQIKENPAITYETFPRILCEKIIEKAKS